MRKVVYIIGCWDAAGRKGVYRSNNKLDIKIIDAVLYQLLLCPLALESLNKFNVQIYRPIFYI